MGSIDLDSARSWGSPGESLLLNFPNVANWKFAASVPYLDQLVHIRFRPHRDHFYTSQLELWITNWQIGINWQKRWEGCLILTSGPRNLIFFHWVLSLEQCCSFRRTLWGHSAKLCNRTLCRQTVLPTIAYIFHRFAVWHCWRQTIGYGHKDESYQTRLIDDCGWPHKAGDTMYCPKSKSYSMSLLSISMALKE